jgi:hypothetical protein
MSKSEKPRVDDMIYGKGALRETALALDKLSPAFTS